MREIESNMSILTKQVIDDRIKGKTFEEIAVDIGIPVADVVKEWTAYTSSRTVMSKEDQWVLLLLRLEDLLYRANLKLEHSEYVEDFTHVLKILDQIEKLQNLNLSRKEVAEAEAEKLHRLQAEQLIGILEMSKLMMRGMIEEAFEKKTLKAAKEALLTDLGEYTDKALEKLEETVD